MGSERVLTPTLSNNNLEMLYFPQEEPFLLQSERGAVRGRLIFLLGIGGMGFLCTFVVVVSNQIERNFPHLREMNPWCCLCGTGVGAIGIATLTYPFLRNLFRTAFKRH